MIYETATIIEFPMPNAGATMSLTKKAYQAFKRALGAGEIESGKTYSQNEICVLLGQSISPVREALKLLEHEGFVDVRPRAGIQILKPDLDLFRECHQFRRLIEMSAIERYVELVSDEELADLRQQQLDHRDSITGKLPLSKQRPVQMSIEQRLHEGIVGALKNKTILQSYRLCAEKLNLIRIDQGGFTSSQMVRTAEEHLAIIDAADARDATAARKALDEHLKESLNRAVGAVTLSDGFI